jgi:hypothetical protein
MPPSTTSVINSVPPYEMVSVKLSHRVQFVGSDCHFSARFLGKTKSLVGNMTNMLKTSKDDEEMNERCSECLTRIRTILLTLPRDVEACSLIDAMARYIL